MPATSDQLNSLLLRIYLVLISLIKIAQTLTSQFNHANRLWIVVESRPRGGRCACVLII